MNLLPLVVSLGLLGQEMSPIDVNDPVVPQSARVISADQRLVVHGHDHATRSAVLFEISELRNELPYVLGSSEKGSSNTIYPLENNLVVTLYGEPGDPEPEKLFARQIRSVEGSPRYRIDLNVHLARGLDRERLREEALACLLLDKGLKPGLKAGRKVEVAPWIRVGILERMAWRKGAADRGLYRSLFKSGYLLEVEEMLAVEDVSDMDAAQRTAFRISAGGFMMALLGMENGQTTLREFIAAAVANEGEPSLLLRQYFFETGISDKSFAIWWALQMQNLTQNFFSESLTITATETALTQVLQGTLEDGTGTDRVYRLAAFQDIAELPDERRRILLARMKERLGLLSFRCFPSYRPLIEEYGKVINQLESSETEKVAQSLAILEEERALFREVGQRTRDYLDWYRISNASQVSGDFRSYQELKRELETETTANPGPLDRYLSGMQRLYDQ
jgi:hypothetical protein